MIYTIGNRQLNIPETGDQRKIRTPRQVVPYRDMAETCRTLDAVCSYIPTPKKRPLKIVDGIARAGFWAAVFLERWPNCNLYLNENAKDEDCADLLREMFPEAKVETNELSAWTPSHSDILLLDFDAFTLKKLPMHKEILEKLSPTCEWMIIAESACYGFKFGNHRHYGVEQEQDYYKLLDKEMRPILGGKRLVAMSSFSNAAMVLFGKAEGEEIEILPPTHLSVARGNKVYKNSSVTSSKFDLQS